jgi:hypothetical protein
MRTTAPVAAALVLLFLAACSAPQEARIDPTVPYPDAGAGNVEQEGEELGLLSVLTPEIRVDQDGRPYDLDCDSSHRAPTGYDIFDLNGRRVAQVPNHSPLVVSNEGPSDVSLPPGRYLVRLDRPDGRARTFWVTIERQRRSEVDPSLLDPNPLAPLNPPAR